MGAGGTLNLIGSVPAASAMTVNGILNISNPGTGIQARNFASLSIAATGVTNITSPSATGNRIVLVTPSLTITTGGKLDLNSNDMIVPAAGELGYVEPLTAKSPRAVARMDFGLARGLLHQAPPQLRANSLLALSSMTQIRRQAAHWLVQRLSRRSTTKPSAMVMCWLNIPMRAMPIWTV